MQLGQHVEHSETELTGHPLMPKPPSFSITDGLAMRSDECIKFAEHGGHTEVTGLFIIPSTHLSVALCHIPVYGHDAEPQVLVSRFNDQLSAGSKGPHDAHFRRCQIASKLARRGCKLISTFIGGQYLLLEPGEMSRKMG